MLAAKSAAPFAAHGALHQLIFNQAIDSPVTLFAAPAGYLLTESLAARLAARDRPLVWLRFDTEDHDPATCLLSLIAGAQRLCPGIGAATLEQMQRRPGPTAGWPPLFIHLAREFAESLPPASTLVLEHVHYLDGTLPTLGLVGRYFLPGLPAGANCILISDHDLPRAVLPASTAQRGPNDLRLEVEDARVLVERAGVALAEGSLRRAVSLMDGRAEMLVGLCAASTVLGEAAIQHAVNRTISAHDLLTRIADAWLGMTEAADPQALALAARLGYTHPALSHAALGIHAPSSGPWLQPLVDGWVRVRRVWQAPLRTALRAWLRLSFAGGELAAARGETETACRPLAAAAGLFRAQHEAEGACQSLLAESALAARRGHRAFAQAHALAARALAESAGLAWQHAWADWQLSCLTAEASEPDGALAYFDQVAVSAEAVGEPVAAGLIREAEEVVQQQRNLSHQREFYLQAYFVHERAERAAARASSRLPIPPTLSPTAGSALVLDAPTQTAPSSIRGALPLEMVSPEPDAGAHSVGTVVAEPVAPSEAAERPPTTSTLTAHLLGGFRVAVNDSPVESWPKGKGRALLKYLLTHRHRPTPRDVLMEVLWPEADPEAARNRLNVALHGLRRALRSAADVPVIVFEDGAYRLDAGLRLWLDVDEFERHIRSGRQLEAAGKRAAAAAEYEVAIGLYQGDFLADDPYESWPVQQRERLRVDYLEALDRLSQIYFDKSQYASCVALCHLILARDNCREDAHCRLMRCYSRQGQPHLALRQYEACLGALRAELEVNPAPATTQLYERIRRRERV